MTEHESPTAEASPPSGLPSWLRFLIAVAFGHVLASAAVGWAIGLFFCLVLAIDASFDSWVSFFYIPVIASFLVTFSTQLTAFIIIPVSLILLPLSAAAAFFLNTGRVLTCVIGTVTGCILGWGVLVCWRGTQDGLATLPVNFLFGIVAGAAYAEPIWVFCMQRRLATAAALRTT